MYVYVVLYSYVGQPLVRPQNPTQSACRSRSFTLFCEVPPVYGGSYSNISWMLNSTDIDSESAMYSTPNNGRELVIRNVTASTTGDYGCYVKLNNGTFVKGQTYSLQPLGTYICVIRIAMCTVLIESNDE